MKENIIWQDRYFWSDEDLYDLKAELSGPETGYDKETDRYEYVDQTLDAAVDYTINENMFSDACCDLGKEVPNTIIMIADLGLWSGRKVGYKECKSKNLSDLLTDVSGDYCKFYTDDEDFKSVQIHHDGTNYITYRMRSAAVSDDDWLDFLDKLYTGKATEADVKECTVSLKYVVDDCAGF